MGSAIFSAPPLRASHGPAASAPCSTVDISADAGTRGAIAAYRLHPFMRLRAGDHERLVPVEALEGALGQNVTDRFVAVFGNRN